MKNLPVLLYSITDRRSPVRALACGPNGLLLSTDLEGNVIVYENYRLALRLFVDIPCYSAAWVSAGLFLVGDKAGAVTVYDYANGQAIKRIRITVGTNVISSIAATATHVVCGCWDGFIYCYALETGHMCWKSNENLRYAVAACIVGDRAYAGSQTGTLSAYSIQTGEVLNSVQHAHEDIIRQVVSAVTNKTILTCSNDGCVKLWSLDLVQVGGSLASEQSSFCFGVASLVTDSDGHLYVVTASDDGALSLIDVRDQNPVKSVWVHDCTLWSVVCAGRDIIVGTNNGDILVFGDPDATKVPASLALTPAQRAERLAEVEEAVASRRRKQEAENAQDLSKLPKVSEKHRHKGRTAGQTSLFVDGDQVQVFQWTGSEWVRVGDMIGPTETGDSVTAATKLYGGDEFFPAGRYDFLFDVEIESLPGVRPQLPFNMNDNVLDVAERFCVLHKIPKGNVQDIVRFIEVNALGKNQFAPPRKIKQPAAAPGDPVPKSPPPAAADIAAIEPIVFAKPAKWDVVVSKVRELNEANIKYQIPDLNIPGMLSVRLADPYFMKTLTRADELNFLFEYPNEHFNHWEDPYPLLDIMRFYVLNPDASHRLRQTKRLRMPIQFVISLFSRDRSPSPNCALLALRLMTNISSIYAWRDTLTQSSEVLIPKIVRVLPFANPLTNVATLSFCHNLLLGAKHDGRPEPLLRLSNLVRTVLSALPKGQASVEAVRAQTQSLLVGV